MTYRRVHLGILLLAWSALSACESNGELAPGDDAGVGHDGAAEAGGSGGTAPDDAGPPDMAPASEAGMPDTGGDPDGGGGEDAPAPACEGQQVLCDGTCIDPSTDMTFCGARSDCAGPNRGESCAASESCEQGQCQCPCVNGTCSASDGSASQCACAPGWAGALCDRCAPDHYGASCRACLCGDKGTCADGLAGDGTCGCMPGWTGATCELPVRSCSELRDLFPQAGDGTYTIDPDGPEGTLAPLPAHCDMGTAGGGWTLVLNYVHKGGTNPPLEVRTLDLPLASDASLGSDESSTANWGHAHPSLLNALAPAEVRMYAVTAGHSRIVHFKTGYQPCLAYFRTGAGSCLGLDAYFTPLVGHSAEVPTYANKGVGNQGSRAMTEFPFYFGGANHWGIRAGGGRWEVDDWPNNDVHDTIHRVYVRSECPAGRYGIDCKPCPSCARGECSDGLAGDGSCVCPAGWAGATCDICAPGHSGPDCGVCASDLSGVNCAPRVSCKAILADFPSAPSGTYRIDPDGAAGPGPAMDAHCDMSTDGGGWTLVLNYVHAAYRSSLLLPRSDALPLLGEGALGDHEAGTRTWGHASPTLMATLPATELRFHGQSSGGDRIIHFKTSVTSCLEYFSTGVGNCAGIAEAFTALPGHSAIIPGEADKYWSDQGDKAMTEFPFFKAGVNHWSVRGQGNRWEVDNVRDQGTDEERSRDATIHRIFVR